MIRRCRVLPGVWRTRKSPLHLPPSRPQGLRTWTSVSYSLRLSASLPLLSRRQIWQCSGNCKTRRKSGGLLAFVFRCSVGSLRLPPARGCCPLGRRRLLLAAGRRSAGHRPPCHSGLWRFTVHHWREDRVRRALGRGRPSIRSTAAYQRDSTVNTTYPGD